MRDKARRHSSGRGLLPAAAWFLAAAAVLAADASPEEIDVFVGTVKATRDAHGALEIVVVNTLELDERNNEIPVAYKVVLDDLGRKLGETLDGKAAEVEAVMQNKGTEREPEYWLHVKKFQEVKDEGAAQPVALRAMPEAIL